MQTQDVELCDEVIAFDDEIDIRYHRIEKSIEELLAQQSPVATDLRLVLAVLHNSIHLERIGDQSVTIAKLTKLSADLETRHDLVEGLREMGDRAEEMVRIALDSFAEARRRAGARARRTRRADRPHEPARRSTTCCRWPPSPGQQEWGMRMIVVARCIERIGDNAVDIGEQTAFLVTGEVRRSSPMPPTDVHRFVTERRPASPLPLVVVASDDGRRSRAPGLSSASRPHIVKGEGVTTMKKSLAAALALAALVVAHGASRPGDGRAGQDRGGVARRRRRDVPVPADLEVDPGGRQGLRHQHHVLADRLGCRHRGDHRPHGRLRRFRRAALEHASSTPARAAS